MIINLNVDLIRQEMEDTKYRARAWDTNLDAEGRQRLLGYAAALEWVLSEEVKV